MKILGIGTIIEFFGKQYGKVNNERYADIVNCVHIYSDGRVAYWGSVYPECPGEDYEIFTDRVIDSFKPIAFKEEHGDFPFSPGDEVLFRFEEDAAESGLVDKICFIYSSHLPIQWMTEIIDSGGNCHYITQDDVESFEIVQSS